jgi:hypothetical protein
VLALARDILAAGDGMSSGPCRSVLEHLVASLTPANNR